MSTGDSYDVIVVGAGLTGALVAATLAAEGLRIVVLEATQTPGGSVRRQPALAILGTPEPFTQLKERRGEELAHTLWELSSENLVRLEILLNQAGITADKVGTLRLATDAGQSQAFRDSVTQLTTYGYSVGLEDDSRYGELAAINTVDDLVFDPAKLIGKLLDHDNITVELNAEVQEIRTRSDGTRGVWAYQHYLQADKVVFANGIHAVRLDNRLSTHLHAARVHTITFENTKTLARPLILDNGHICFLPWNESAYLVGWDDSETDMLQHLHVVADQLCPEALVHSRFTTRIAVSEDTLPVVGQLPDDRSVYIIGGLGPFGLNLAVIAVDELVELVLDDRRPTLFALNRFVD